MKAATLCHMERYQGTVRVFTDAAKTTEGAPAVASAFFIEDLNWGHAERLDDTASIYAAELHAIKLAVE
jgi:hypothetical protein